MVDNSPADQSGSTSGGDPVAPLARRPRRDSRVHASGLRLRRGLAPPDRGRTASDARQRRTRKRKFAGSSSTLSLSGSHERCACEREEGSFVPRLLVLDGGDALR